VSQEEDRLDHFAETIEQIILGRANHLVSAGRAEQYFGPAILKLAQNEEEGQFLNTRLEEFGRKLGGPPQLLIKTEGEELKSYNTYPVSAIHEVVEWDWKSRRSLVETQLAFIALRSIQE
jgi:hypothetical protein